MLDQGQSVHQVESYVKQSTGMNGQYADDNVAILTQQLAYQTCPRHSGKFGVRSDEAPDPRREEGWVCAPSRALPPLEHWAPVLHAPTTRRSSRREWSVRSHSRPWRCWELLSSSQFLSCPKRRRTVKENSAAIAALQSLNQNYQQRLKYPDPIVYNWEDRVNSKAKLDRYDLHKFFLATLAVLEDQILNQIAVQIKDAS